MSEMPLSYRGNLKLGVIKSWIRALKINPDDPEIRVLWGVLPLSGSPHSKADMT
jgi:hypothetical protein